MDLMVKSYHCISEDFQVQTTPGNPLDGFQPHAVLFDLSAPGAFNYTSGDQPETYDVNTYDSFASTASSSPDKLVLDPNLEPLKSSFHRYVSFIHSFMSHSSYKTEKLYNTAITEITVLTKKDLIRLGF